MQLKAIEMMGKQTMVLAGQLFDGRITLGDRGLKSMSLAGDYVVLRFDNGGVRLISTMGIAMEPESSADLETLLKPAAVAPKGK